MAFDAPVLGFKPKLYNPIQSNPTSNSKKCDIVQWLTENSINHDPSKTKRELLNAAKEHKYLEVYEIDKLARDNGHEVLRLPPYHCEFNPIELIWAKIKNEVKKKNSNDKQTLKNVEEKTKCAINKVTAEDWKACIRHTRQVEEQYRRKDTPHDHFIGKLVINTASGSSESDTDNC